MRVRRYLFLWLSAGLLLSLPAQAHKLKVFAAAEGDEILGQAYFVGGAPAGGALVTITDEAGHELARLEPDAEGNFRYRVERRMTYKVLADSRDGHVASWTLGADEFSSDLPGEATGAAAENPAASAGAAATASAVSIPGGQPVATAQVERAVARQIRPLRQALQEHDERVRLRDILGGIGYIFGLAGLGLWWRGRGRQK